MKVDGEEYTTDEGFLVEFFYDDDRENPREESDCHVGTMLYNHTKYVLGDVKVDGMHEALAYMFDNAPNHTPTCKKCGDEIEDDYGEFVHVNEADCERVAPDVSGFVILPLFLYDHSGLSLSTTTAKFLDPGNWDTSSVGIIYFDLAKVAEHFGEVENPVEMVTEALLAEVKEFDQYLQGDVYGYVISRDGKPGRREVHESCWGFYGFDTVKGEAKSILEAITKEEAEYEAKSFVVLCESIGHYERLDVGHEDGYKQFAENWVQDHDEADLLIKRLKNGQTVYINEDNPRYIQRYSTGE